jgi:hypothetical protein
MVFIWVSYCLIPSNIFPHLTCHPSIHPLWWNVSFVFCSFSNQVVWFFILSSVYRQ